MKQLVEMSYGVQIEALLKRKRKPGMYNLIKKMPIEIEQVDSLPMVAIELLKINDNYFVKPYRLHNGQQYTPVTNLFSYNNDNVTRSFDGTGSMVDNDTHEVFDKVSRTFQRDIGMELKSGPVVTLNDLNNNNLIPLNYRFIDPLSGLSNTLTISEDSIKQQFSDNDEYQQRQFTRNINNNLILCGDQLYYRTYGKFYTSKSNYAIHSPGLKNLYDYRHGESLSMDKLIPGVLKRASINNIYPISLLRGASDDDYYGSQEKNNLNGLFITDMKSFSMTNQPLYGPLIFNAIFNEPVIYKMANLSVATDNREKELNDFIEHFFMHMECEARILYDNCINNDYNIEDVMTFADYLLWNKDEIDNIAPYEFNSHHRDNNSKRIVKPYSLLSEFLNLWPNRKMSINNAINTPIEKKNNAFLTKPFQVEQIDLGNELKIIPNIK